MRRRPLLNRDVVFKDSVLSECFVDYKSENPFYNHYGSIIKDDISNDLFTIKLVRPVTFRLKGIRNRFKTISEIVLSRSDVELIPKRSIA